MNWSLNAAPKEKDPRLAVATAFSLIRSISVPLGLADPVKPNIAATIWRAVSDTGAGRLLKSSYSPSIFWVDLKKLKLAPGSAPAKLELSEGPILDGEVSDKFVQVSRSSSWRIRSCACWRGPMNNSLSFKFHVDAP